ncbi:MAG TPA: hypothetical protein VIN09_01635 [Chloroflexota bacterium]
MEGVVLALIALAPLLFVVPALYSVFRSSSRSARAIGAQDAADQGRAAA